MPLPSRLGGGSERGRLEMVRVSMLEVWLPSNEGGGRLKTLGFIVIYSISSLLVFLFIKEIVAN
jgi:hypothetical protein